MNRPRRPTGVKKPKKELTKSAPKRGRYKVPRERNFNTMTDAEYNGMINKALRSVSTMWKPINECKKLARVSRGMYKCACCDEIVRGKEGKTVNIAVDHKYTVTPLTGVRSWDDVISRLFCELETGNLQLLCLDCHKVKTNAENKIRREYKKGAIDLNPDNEYYVDVKVIDGEKIPELILGENIFEVKEDD